MFAAFTPGLVVSRFAMAPCVRLHQHDRYLFRLTRSYYATYCQIKQWQPLVLFRMVLKNTDSMKSLGSWCRTKMAQITPPKAIVAPQGLWLPLLLATQKVSQNNNPVVAYPPARMAVLFISATPVPARNKPAGFWCISTQMLKIRVILKSRRRFHGLGLASFGVLRSISSFFWSIPSVPLSIPFHLNPSSSSIPSFPFHLMLSFF